MIWKLCIKFEYVENYVICFVDNIFYFKIFFIVTNKYNTTFIPFLLIRYIFKRWWNITNTHTHTHTHTRMCVYMYVCVYTMLILNMFINIFYCLQIILWKNNLQDIIIVQMHFQSNYLIFWLIFFYRSVDLGKIFLNDFFFHLDKVWKK
jgi:hypothetical protein